jgi:hypothetical protein
MTALSLVRKGKVVAEKQATQGSFKTPFPRSFTGGFDGLAQVRWTNDYVPDMLTE